MEANPPLADEPTHRDDDASKKRQGAGKEPALATRLTLFRLGNPHHMRFSRRIGEATGDSGIRANITVAHFVSYVPAGPRLDALFAIATTQ